MERRFRHSRASSAPTRRAVLQGASFAAALGAPIPFLDHLPIGLVPIALAGVPVPGKSELSVLSERPLNLETPAHLLDDATTPAQRMFVRNNGLPPSSIDASAWRLRIDGEVNQPLDLSIQDLKTAFETISMPMVLECGGNGRKFFAPSASGLQWTFGAVACPVWTGVRLRDVLSAAGVKNTAVYTAHYGADQHLSGATNKFPLSRGVPIAKAIESHSMIAWAINGEAMPVLNGHPLRLVIPGWPGSCSQKWLTRVELRDRVHNGAKMTGKSYRVPNRPVAPGETVDDADMEIITQMPVKSLVTAPATGARVMVGETFEARGHAWAGESDIASVDISLDFGASWRRAALDPPVNKYAWRRWRSEIVFPEAGYYEIWARATDDKGMMQPPMAPGWNPKGYLNNMQHRIAVFADA